MAYQIVLKLPNKNDEDIVFDFYEDLNPIWQLLGQYDNAQLAIVPKEEESSGVPSVDNPTKIQENNGGEKPVKLTKEQVVKYIKDHSNVDNIFTKAIDIVDRIGQNQGYNAVSELLGDWVLENTYLRDKNTLVDKMAEDAVAAGLTEAELVGYPQNWLYQLKNN